MAFFKKSGKGSSKQPGSPTSPTASDQSSSSPRPSLSSLVQASTKLAWVTSSGSYGSRMSTLKQQYAGSLDGASSTAVGSSNMTASMGGTSGGISAASGGGEGQIEHSGKRVWVDRGISVFRVLKEVSEASELLGPLKLVSGLMITVLESAQASIKNSEAWEALRATLERHRSLLTRHFERAEEEGTRRKADPNLLEILLDYGDALEDILVCVLKEMGVSEEDIPPSTGTNLKRKLAKVGLTGLEAERIKGYSDRLSTALQHLM
ncbi:hypothetical protein FRC18_003703, partial [Serendipita sp. 400]